MTLTAARRPASLLRALQWFGASYGLAILGYLVTNAAASRWLGLDQYGYFVALLTGSTVLGQLALVGAHRGGLRVAAVMTEGDEGSLRVLRAGASAAVKVTLPLVSLAAGVAVWAVSRPHTDQALLMGGAFALLVALSGLQKLWANYLRGFGDIRLSSLIEGRSGGAAVSLLQALFVVAMWQLAAGTELAGALVGLTLGFAIPVLYAGRRVTRRWRALPRDGRLWADLRSSVSRNWRFGLNQFATYLSGNVEIWIAGLFLLSADASLFSAAQRLALLLAIPLTSVQVVFAPVAARLLAKGDTERLQPVLRTGASLAAALAAVALVPMLLFPGGVMALVFGGEFDAGSTALFLLALGGVANVASGLCGTALTMSHHEGFVAGVQTASVVLRVVAGSLAAYAVGITGLAVAAAATTAATYLLLWAATRRRLNLWTHPTLTPSLALMRRIRG